MFVANRNESKSYTSTTTTSSSSVQWSQHCRHFELNEILLATENFDESLIIGRGGSAKVYRGDIKNGPVLVVAAIKRLNSMSNQGESEFWAEVEMLSKLRHCHLVSLVGYCKQQGEMILVYEYISHGTLADHLHKLATPLSWCQRLKICIGAARGLDYLHTGTGIEFGIIHRDVKSSNILLNESWASKVSDFGLSKISPTNQPSTYVSTLVKGTFGYFDPNYFATGKLTRKSDVYAFGVVLLEVLCRKRAVDDSLEWGIATWAQDSIKQGHLKNIVDYHIRGEISPKCLKEYAQIVEKCLHNHPKHRPTMAEVVLRLEYVLTLQEKTNNMSQTASKTIFGKVVDKFSFTSYDHSLGMKFESLVPHKPHIDMDFGFLVPKKTGEQPPLSLHGNRHYSSSTSLNMCRRFTFDEIKVATNNFSEARLLGFGGYDNVYKGEINGGATEVAIKRGKALSNQGANGYRMELEVLSKLCHRHLVALVGYCRHKTEMILVYDYMTCGSLRDHLYKTQNQPLTWNQRLEICIGAARGLHYLHTGAEYTIIHKDVKTSNILLDNNWVAKVSNFEPSKMGLSIDHTHTPIKGRFGYLDPEYFRKQKLTEKSDVYSFGVVLLEILSARPPIDPKAPREQANLANWALQCHKKGIPDQIVDPYLRGKIARDCFKEVVETTVKCLADHGIDRPSMRDVLLDLEYALALQRHVTQGKILDSTSNRLSTNISCLSLSSKDTSDFNKNTIKLC